MIAICEKQIEKDSRLIKRRMAPRDKSSNHKQCWKTWDNKDYRYVAETTTIVARSA